MLKKILLLFFLFSANASAAEYRLTFSDSGVGGLIFALDVLKIIEPELVQLQNEYDVSFVIHHIADSVNAPYSPKSDEELRALVIKLVSYQSSLPNANTNVLACNTASTMVDDKMRRIFDKKIITMVESSADQLNEDSRGGFAVIFATERTIRSGQYQKLVRNNIAYVPAEWAADIENGKIDERKINKTLVDFAEKNKIDFSLVKSVGLFCTHYPFFEKQIREFFKKHGSRKLSVIRQGNVFARIIMDDVRYNLPRKYLIKKFKSSQAPIKIISEFTDGRNLKARKLVKNYYPEFYERIIWEK